MQIQTLTINNNTLELLPQKAIYWQEIKTLIVSDLHLGRLHIFVSMAWQFRWNPALTTCIT